MFPVTSSNLVNKMCAWLHISIAKIAYMLKTGWDLWPETLCCSICTWQMFPSNKIQRIYKGLKITAWMCSWGNLWTIRYKKTEKTQMLLMKKLEQKQDIGSKSRDCPFPLHSTPPKGWANPSGPTPRHNPTLTPHKESDLLPASGSKHVFLLSPSTAVWVPIRPCLNFLSGF